MDVDPVGDELHVCVVVQQGGDGDTRRSMVDAGHRVEQVGRRASTRGVRIPGAHGTRRRVPDRHHHALVVEPADEIRGTGKLRGERQETQTVDQRFERLARGTGRFAKMGRRVGTALARSQERTLEIEPERLRAVGRRGRHPCPDPVGEGGERVEWRRDRGRQERRHAPPKERLRHAIQGVGIAHRIVAAPAVDMDVDEPGRDVGQTVVGGLQVDGSDPAVLDRDTPALHPVVEDEPAADDLGGHSGEPLGSKSGSSTSNCTSSP